MAGVLRSPCGCGCVPILQICAVVIPQPYLDYVNAHRGGDCSNVHFDVDPVLTQSDMAAAMASAWGIVNAASFDTPPIAFSAPMDLGVGAIKFKSITSYPKESDVTAGNEWRNDFAPIGLDPELAHPLPDSSVGGGGNGILFAGVPCSGSDGSFPYAFACKTRYIGFLPLCLSRRIYVTGGTFTVDYCCEKTMVGDGCFDSNTSIVSDTLEVDSDSYLDVTLDTTFPFYGLRSLVGWLGTACEDCTCP